MNVVILKTVLSITVAILSGSAIMALFVNTQDRTLPDTSRVWAKVWICIHFVAMITGITLLWAAVAL